MNEYKGFAIGEKVHFGGLCYPDTWGKVIGFDEEMRAVTVKVGDAEVYVHPEDLLHEGGGIMEETRYNVVITVIANDIVNRRVERHIEEDVTFAQAMSETKRQAEYIGSDCVKSVHIDFIKRG